jgi:membrane-associated phospholipid phosphatase
MTVRDFRQREALRPRNAATWRQSVTLLFWLGCACSAAVSRVAMGQESAPPLPPPRAGHPKVKSSPPPVPPEPARLSAPILTYDLRVDVPVVVGAYVAWSTLQALNHEIGPTSCRWCDANLNALDRGARDDLRWAARDQHIAVTASDIGANALAPAASVGLGAILAAHDDRFASVPVDIVVIAEAVAIAGVVTQVTKYSVGRTRPFVRALPQEQHPDYGHGDDAYVSFYSGHTSYAFSLATAAGTVASLRRYRGAEWVWIAGLSVAAATGYFRIAADEHYLTDVLASAASASAIGFGVPFLFHHPTRYLVPLTPVATPAAGGGLVSVQGAF